VNETKTRVLTLGTRITDDGDYEGVLRESRKIVLTCGHSHSNRDISTQANGMSARDCIATLVRSARNDEFATQVAGQIRNSMNDYIRVWQVTALAAERFRADAAARADAFLASLPGVAEVVGNEPVYGYTGHVEIIPVTPPDATCAHCGQHIEPQKYGIGGWFDWQSITKTWTGPRHEPNCPVRGYRGHEPENTEA
jgi:hypothetical protein